MAKSRKQVREKQIASEAAQATSTHLSMCNDAYTTGAFKYLRILVHLVAAAQFIFGFYYHQFKVHWPKDPNSVEEEDPKENWGGKFKFLTFLGVILQAIYHTLALVNDFWGDNKINAGPQSLLRRLRDYVFASFAFPVAYNVCISFWVIYLWDRELIFPTALDEIFPSWLNHVVHTNVALMGIMDMVTCFRRYPQRTAGVAGNVGFMLLYIVWIHIVHHFSGRWAYPLLEVLSLPWRYVMLSALLGFNLILYFMGEIINSAVWAPELKLLKQWKAKQN